MNKSITISFNHDTKKGIETISPHAENLNYVEILGLLRYMQSEILLKMHEPVVPSAEIQETTKDTPPFPKVTAEPKKKPVKERKPSKKEEQQNSFDAYCKLAIDCANTSAFS